MKETWFQPPGWKDLLEEEVAPHSVFLLVESHGEKSLATQSMGSQRVGHD